MNSKRTIALVYDLDNWVLGLIARSMKRFVEPATRVEYRLHNFPASISEFNDLQRNADAVHFLSPWLFFEYHSVTYRPSIVTVHHLTDETSRNLSLTAHHIDALCYTNNQCCQMLKELDCVDESLLFSTSYGLETDFFRPDPTGRIKLIELLSCPPDTVVIGFSAKKTSNDSSRKGLDRYFKLMEQLICDYGDKIKLVVFGPGSESPNGWTYEDFPSGIQSHVHIPGYQPYDRLPVYYSGLDCYVCLSSIEGGPYPAMECMACEVPVISTEVGVTKTLINDGVNGYLVTFDDYLEKIPGVLSTLRNDPLLARSVGERARAAVVKFHSWEHAKLCRDYDLIYDRSQISWDARPFLHKACKQLFSLVGQYS